MLKDTLLNKKNKLTSDSLFKRAIILASSPAYKNPLIDPVKLARELCKELNK
jgi:hypothetical protein